MAYDEDTLNGLHDRPMTGRRNKVKTITATDAIRGLRDIVAEFGPDTTRKCQYVEYANGADQIEAGEAPTGPHCIVGVFLNRNGVSLEALESIEGESINSAVSNLRDLIRVDESARAILWEAQCTQDGGSRWGRALDFAENVFETQKDGK